MNTLKRLNEQLSVFRFLFQEGEESMPPWILFGTTFACNLTCPHCETHGTPEVHRKFNLKEYRMTPDLLRSAAAEALPYASAFSLTQNGEPLASPGFAELMRFVRPFGAKLDLTTNGTLLTPARLAEMLPVLGWVHISIDGATPYTIERIRRGAQYARLMRTIRLLVVLSKRGDFHVDLAFTIMASNIRELPLVARLAERLGVRAVHFCNVEPHFSHVRNEPVAQHRAFYNHYRKRAVVTALKAGVELDLPAEFAGVTPDPTPPAFGPGYLIDEFPDDYDPDRLPELDFAGIDEEAERILSQVEATECECVPVDRERVEAMRAELAMLTEKHGNELRRLWAEDAKIPWCGHLYRAVRMHPQGELFPCCTPGQPALGNAAVRSVRKVWNGPIMDDLRKRFFTDDPFPCCKGCFWKTEIRAREYFTRMGIEHIADPEAAGERLALADVRIEAGCMQGYVDRFVRDDGELWVEGWSYDPRGPIPARRIAIASDRELLYARAPNIERPDLVALTGCEAVRKCGFSFRVTDVPSGALRVLGISSENSGSVLERSTV